MGIGDEIMLAGEARYRAAGRALRYRMLDKVGQSRWHFVWTSNPNVARPGERCDGEIGFINGKRNYIEDVKPERYTFRQYTPRPAYLHLGPQALVFPRQAAGAVVFNPAIKNKASPNKAWPLQSWERLIALTPKIRWVQLQEPGVRRVGRVEMLVCNNFMDAVGALSGATAAVLQEGALHHAAAAVGTPAIVIRGGFISPKVTGYDGQVDFYVEDERWPLGCGMRVACDHCKAAMASITPEKVAEALLNLLNGGKDGVVR